LIFKSHTFKNVAGLHFGVSSFPSAEKFGDSVSQEVSRGRDESLRTSVNFTIILQEDFCKKVFLKHLQFGFVFFCQRNVAAKAARKILA
jgi:hypothetical protein